MSNDFDLTQFQDMSPVVPDVTPDAHDQTHDVSHSESSELHVPQFTGTLSDGSEIIVIGDVAAFAEYNHKQGDNDQNCKGDCGLVSTADVLNQFGIHVTENDVVHHAAERGECNVIATNPEDRGGSSVEQIAQIMGDYGIAAHVETKDDMNSLIAHLQQGHSVIIGVNAGYLWNDPQYLGDGSPNHALTVTGMACDPQTGQVTGFFVNDSGDGNASKFIPNAQMQQMWVTPGGYCVATDAAQPAHPDMAHTVPSPPAPVQPGHPQPGHPATPQQPASSHDNGNLSVALSSLVLVGVGMSNLSRASKIKKQ